MRPFPKEQFARYPKEFSELKTLKTPERIQDFLNRLPFNFEPRGETYRSPLSVLRSRIAHCMEGAMLAAAALWLQGRSPILLDLKTTNNDVDHVVALFREGGRWGAISKTNHAVLRYRDPIYASTRELAMSYFNEYFLDTGKKTMRSFSRPFDLSRFGSEWLVTGEDLHAFVAALDRSPHIPIFTKKNPPSRLRRAEPIEIKAGKIVEYKKKKPRTR